MKRMLLIALALVLIVAMALPVMVSAADPITPGATVNVATGGGIAPVVKVKWEQQPTPLFANTEDGDPTHLDPGFQILPPLEKCVTKTIEYYAVVTDVEDGGNLSQVFADVYHPTGSPEPYGPSVTGGMTNAGYFKYEIPFINQQLGTTPIMSKAQAIAKLQKAYDDKLVTFNPAILPGTPTQAELLAEVIYELNKGTAKLWMGDAEIDYEQPAGEYQVYDYAVDTNNNFSPYLWNEFEYIPVAGIEVDFTSVDFGSVNLGVEKMIPGDIIWDLIAGISNTESPATVRNIGNTWASVTVKFTDMGFGQDVNGNWNVNFDARMGNDDAFYVTGILPNQTITLVNALDLSTQDELDLSIKIIKGSGSHSGVITLGAVERAFDYPIVNVVGFASPCDPDQDD